MSPTPTLTYREWPLWGRSPIAEVTSQFSTADQRPYVMCRGETKPASTNISLGWWYSPISCKLVTASITFSNHQQGISAINFIPQSELSLHRWWQESSPGWSRLSLCQPPTMTTITALQHCKEIQGLILSLLYLLQTLKWWSHGRSIQKNPIVNIFLNLFQAHYKSSQDLLTYVFNYETLISLHIDHTTFNNQYSPARNRAVNNLWNCLDIHPIQKKVTELA